MKNMNFNVPSFTGGYQAPSINRPSGATANNSFPKTVTKSILHQPGQKTSTNVDQKR